MTKIGSSPGAPGQAGTQGGPPADGSWSSPPPGSQGHRRTDTRPGRVPVPVLDRDDDAGGYATRGRRRLPVIPMLIAVFVLIIGVGVVAGYQVVRGQYYVSSNGGNVAIYRGINDKLLGISLFSVYETTSIPVSGITAGAAQELSRADTGSLAMARQFVANIRKQYNTCQAARAAVASWKAHKPKPRLVKKIVHGKPVTVKVTPKYPPEPTIPSFCPPAP